MRILVYGAGNIGSLYAARLAQGSHEVSILARGTRLAGIRRHGITLEHALTSERTTTPIEAVDRLAPDDAYDLVLVVLPRHRISQVLPVLAANRNTPSVMFFGNNVAGPSEMIDALGRDRVLLGFPGAGAIPGDGAVRYFITSAREQPTTIGELDGSKSARIVAAAAALEAAGFPVAICANMDAWLKTHVAKILPTVGALFRAGGDLQRLARDDGGLRWMVHGIREGFAVLRANDVPVTPANHRVLEWLPKRVLLALMGRIVNSEGASVKMGHAEQGRAEWQRLADEFRPLIDRAGIATPAIDVLNRHIRPSAEATFVSDEVRAVIEDELLRAGVPGCAVACTSPGVPMQSLEFGTADVAAGRAVQPTTRFHLFSGTKLYTAAALMLLAERDAIDLDASILDYLPELPLKKPITVRQLASHASGLSDTLGGVLAVHLPDEPAPSAAKALERYRLDGGRDPGGAARYRNVNYAILGELVARVSGHRYVDFVQREVLAPLGAELDFGDAASSGGERAVGYVPRLSPMRLALRIGFPDVARRIYAGRSGALTALRDYALDTAAIGGLVGAAAEFLPLLRELLSSGDGLLQAESKREMLSMHSRGPAGVVSTQGVGIGWKRGTVDGVAFWNHEGGGAGFCSETRLYPSDGLGIVILMNRSQTRGLSRACHRICEAIRSGVPATLDKPQSRTKTARHDERYELNRSVRR